MGKSSFRTALTFAAAVGGFLSLDLIMDQLIGGTPTLNLPHVFLSIGIVIVAFIMAAQALETRRRAEIILQQGHDELEMRVQQRTAELELANATLQAEIVERQRIELDRQQTLDQMEKARRHAEDLAAELQLTNGMLHALFDTLPVGMLILNTDGEIAMANPLARSIMGIALTGDAADENGAPLLFHLDGSPVYPQDLPLNRALRNGETTTGMEVFLRRPEGDKTFIYIAAGPVRDELGRISGAVKIVQDISELKHMEQALRESEERYRTQFDFFPESSMVWDRNGILLMQNLVAARNLGGRREDFVGKTAQEIYGDGAVEFLQRLNRVMQTGGSDTREDEVDLGSGKQFFWTTAQRIRNTDGQFAIQMISYDITARKRVELALRTSEEKFATVFHFSPDAIAIVRRSDSVLLDVNAAATKILGLSPADLVGKSWQDLGLFSDMRQCDQMIAQYLRDGRVTDYELDFVAPGGQGYTVLISLISIQVSGEDCVLIITHDITTRKRSEEALRQIQAELALGIQERTAMQERQRLARELHDSVSQALYGISLGAHTALTLIDSDRAKVIEAIDYVVSLAQAGLAEMRALIFELRPESLELEGLVKALSKQSAALRARHGIEIELNLCDEPQIPISVKEIIYRIAQEALQNAVKHARPDRLSVRLCCAEDQLELEVSDNGIGFDPLAAYPGHLGLRSMRERAVNVGGQFEIVSAPNCGTQIRAIIPVLTQSVG